MISSWLCVSMTLLVVCATATADFINVTVTPSVVFQDFLGVGAAMTETTASLVMSMNSETRRDFLATVYGRSAGVGFSAMRIVMGSCDFSLSNYTYDDIPANMTSDFQLSHFSIAHDLQTVIPAIREALAVNPSLKIIATPWSAPAWMKVPATLFGGNLSSDPMIRSTYARYFRRYVEAYKTAGVPIFAVTVQNEPRFSTSSYPSMFMTPEDEQEMALRIAHEFEQSTIINNQTKVIVYDHNWDDPQYPITVLENRSVLESDTIIGAAFHCYAGQVQAQSLVKQAVPSKRLFFTECCGGAWAPNFGSNLVWDTQNLVVGAVVNYAETVIKWNLLLDSNNGPHLPAACTNCWGLGTLWENGTYSFHEDFYSLGHLSIFLGEHNQRIKTTDDVNTVALLSSNSTNSWLVVVVLNPTNTATTISLTFSMQNDSQCVATFDLAGDGLASLRVPMDGSSGTIQWVLTTGNQENLLSPQGALQLIC